MGKKRIVICFGGYACENEISIITSLKIYQELIKHHYPTYLVYLDQDGNFYTGKGLTKKENYINKKEFYHCKIKRKNHQYYFVSKMKKTYFDYVYILGHGKNIEDGTLSSYFFIKKIPYLYDDLNNVSLLQDKIKSKMMFQHLKVPTLDYFSLHQGHKISSKSIPFAYPLIVKPNTLGSSIGVSQVNDFSSLISALQEIYLYDETCIIEPCVTKKKEYNIALSGYLDELKISHIECVNSFDDVLSFYDKYDYSSSNKKRIIDPLIDEAIKNQMIDDAKKIFNSLNLCGTYRFDFLFDEVNQQLYLNEINVLPGSLAFYLFEKETKMIDLILFDIKMKEKKYFKREHLLTSYQEGYITQLAIEKMIK